MTKHLGWYVLGAAVVAGFAYTLYKTATPPPNSSSTPNDVSTTAMAPLNAITWGIGGQTALANQSAFMLDTSINQTNPQG